MWDIIFSYKTWCRLMWYYFTVETESADVGLIVGIVVAIVVVVLIAVVVAVIAVRKRKSK